MKLWAIVPELILGGLCLLLVPVAGWSRGRWRSVPAWIAGAGLVAAIVASAAMLGWGRVDAFGGAYVVDPFATAFKLVVLAGALVSLGLLAGAFRGRLPLAHAPVALLFATLGGVALLSANDLALVVLFLQMMSMAGYVLLALVREERRALEATLKYFLYAAVALAVMAYGLTFLYGLTGSLSLEVIGATLVDEQSVWAWAALALVVVGYGFEIAAVPFHFWAPDVLDGGTAPVAGFLSVVPKTAAMGALSRFLFSAVPVEIAPWEPLVWILAVASMTVGNLAALRQTSLKRLLAWSTVAQSGYVLAAVSVAPRTAAAPVAVAFYLATYTFMNLGAFGVAAVLERAGEDDRIPSLRGLLVRAPMVGAVLVISVLSLAGIPPLAGFAGKVLVFETLFDGGAPWLAAIAAANMVVALYYYVRVAAEAVFGRPLSDRLAPGWLFGLTLVTCLAALVALGVIPAPFLSLFQGAARAPVVTG